MSCLPVPPTTDAARSECAPGWEIRGGRLSLHRPLTVGILNLTPDSFSDGGRYTVPQRAVEHAHRLVRQGADLLDIGGESTRPGARPVPADEEAARVLPVIEQLHRQVRVPLSLDTQKAAVAEAGLHAGVAVINDVSALADPRMAEVVAAAGAGLVLMHMRGTPATMQQSPTYGDVVEEVAVELERSRTRAQAAGVPAARIALDPGIGFGKTAAHNWALIAGMPRLCALGSPVLLGVSRKAFLGALLGGADPDQRDVATAAACVVGFFGGARIFRVHNVRPVREALAVAAAVANAGPEAAL